MSLRDIIYSPMLLVKSWNYEHKDKVMHFVVGLLITIVFGLLIDAVFGLFIGLFAGNIKELLDKYVIKGTYDIYDAIATWLGSIVGFILIVGT